MYLIITFALTLSDIYKNFTYIVSHHFSALMHKD